MHRTTSHLPKLLFFAISFPYLAGAATGCDGAGNCYVRAGAAGSANGGSWTNACPSFSGSCSVTSSSARGITFWVAAGGYSATTFSAADSGTTITAIEAATVPSHGPATDWSNSYAGTAVFAADTTISSDYWKFDGQAWPAACSSPGLGCGTSGYNIFFHNTTDPSTTGAALIVTGGAPASPRTSITLRYVEIEGVINGTSDDGGLEVTCSTNNLYVGYSYIHDAGVDLVQAQYTCSGQNYTGTNWTFEYDYFARNHRGDSSAHSQAIATGAQDLIVRYSTLFDITSSGGITDPFPGDVALQNWYVYGNAFVWDNSQTAGVGDGFVGLFGESFTGVLYVVNNTLANVNNSTCPSGVCNSPALFVCGTSCGSSGTVSAAVENNLWWNPSYGQGVSYDSSSPWTATEDYNQAYCASSGCSYSGTFVTGGSHDKQSNTGDPFTSFNGTSAFGTALAADTSPGVVVPGWSSLPSGCTATVNCMNIDALGVVRGANGTLDRGALQISGTLPAAPNGLTATVQ